MRGGARWRKLAFPIGMLPNETAGARDGRAPRPEEPQAEASLSHCGRPAENAADVSLSGGAPVGPFRSCKRFPCTILATEGNESPTGTGAPRTSEIQMICGSRLPMVPPRGWGVIAPSGTSTAASAARLRSTNPNSFAGQPEASGMKRTSRTSRQGHGALCCALRREMDAARPFEDRKRGSVK